MARKQSTTSKDRTQPSHTGLKGLVCGVIVFATLLAFRPALDGQFLNWDDDRNFVANLNYRGAASDNFHWAWQTYHMGVWQPAAWTLLRAEHVIAGVNASGVPNPGAYHAFSIALHTLNGLMLFALLITLIRTARSDASARDETGLIVSAGAAALLFVVHPLRTEVTAWVSGQPYLPAVFFSMLGLWFYLRGHARKRQGDTAWLALFAAFVWYCLAVLFKAVAITLPVLLLIIDVFPLRRLEGKGRGLPARLTRILVEKLPFFVVAIFIAKFAADAKAITNPGSELSGLPLTDRLIQSCYGIVFYLSKTLMPTDLGPFYELPASFDVFDPRFGGAIAFVLVGVVSLIVFCRRIRAVVAAMLAFFVILLPNLGIIQISQQLVADRYSYFASIPLAALFAGLVYWLLTRGPKELRTMRFTGVALAIVVACLSLIRVSRVYASAWRDSRSLWSYALQLDSDSPHAHCNLGAAMIEAGDYPGAMTHLKRAIELRSDFVFAYSNLGLVLMELQDWQGAVDAYEMALRVINQMPAEDQSKTYKGLAAARYELGVQLTTQQDWPGVVNCYEKLLPMADRLPLEYRAHVSYGLAIAYFESGQADRAWKHLREAQQLGIPAELINSAIQRY